MKRRALMQVVVTFDSSVEEVQHIDELDGALASNPDQERLMHSVLDSDEETIAEGKIVLDAVNQGINSLTPDMLFEKLVTDYKQAEKLFGETILRESTGYDPNYIQKNIKIPEFRKELRNRLDQFFKKLKDDKIIDKEGVFTDDALSLASFVLYTDELDTLVPKGAGAERFRKSKDAYGIKEQTKAFTKDRYRDLALRKSIRKAVGRGHSAVIRDDLVAFERESRGKSYVIYALDASGSMKGDKISNSKRAGVALSFRGVEDRNEVGLIVFGDDVHIAIPPSKNFPQLLKEIVRVQARGQTDIGKTLLRAIDLFPREPGTKHIMLISDGLPTSGNRPEKDAIEAAYQAKQQGVTLSVVGIQLDKKGKELGEKLAQIGDGKLYGIQELKDLQQMVLQDYQFIQEAQ